MDSKRAEVLKMRLMTGIIAWRKLLLYARVYIRPDLTKKQLQESKNLYAELLEKRGKYPAKVWKISKGVIIEVGQHVEY